MANNGMLLTRLRSCRSANQEKSWEDDVGVYSKETFVSVIEGGQASLAWPYNTVSTGYDPTSSITGICLEIVPA